MNPSISVIVTTYNWPGALGAVLESLASQSYADYQVVVADDGSGPETARVVERAAAGDREVLHVWQEDRGFRAAAARNRAVAASSGDYLVFLDGDCLVRPDFVRRHAELAAPGRFTAGNRILLSRPFSERLLETREGAWRGTAWPAARLRGDINRLLPLLRLPDGAWRDRRPQRWQGVKTCNLGLWRSDFLAVNGLDEAYQGWGYEDSDLAIRLIRQGVRRRDGRFATTVLHLWHAEHERDGTRENLARLHAQERGRSIRAGQGVDRYLDPAPPGR